MMTLKVNGREHQVDADPDTPLLYVLRDDLKLNGAKFGCGLGQCGACTVIVDGKAVLSCVTPMVLLEGKQVTTLEGLGTIDGAGADPARLHRRAGGAMRLLHRRHDDAGAGAAAAQSQADRRADPRRARAESVPLRHPYAHPARGASRGEADGHRGCVAGSRRERADERPRDPRSPPRARRRRRADRQLLARGAPSRSNRTRRPRLPRRARPAA